MIWFNIQFAICNMQYAICNIQYSVFNIQYSIFIIQYSIFNIQYSIFNIQYSIFISFNSDFIFITEPIIMRGTQRLNPLCLSSTFHQTSWLIQTWEQTISTALFMFELLTRQVCLKICRNYVLIFHSAEEKVG